MEAQAAPAEPSLAPLAPAADVPVASEAEAEAAFAEPYPAPLAGAADAPVDAEAESELAAAPPPEAAAKAPESGSRIATEPAAAASLPETGPGTFQEETSVPAAGPESRELPDSGEEGTAAFWRVLEGLVAFAGALFLVGLVRKMRLSHGVDRR
jgi:hypothetical protein